MLKDVIVIGAGPAGSMCARRLARHGHSILLLDKAFFPRPKICGDCLTPRCWDLWEQENLLTNFKNLPHYDILDFHLSSGTNSSLKIPLPSCEKKHRAVARSTMDAWLLSEAESSGVSVKQGITISDLFASSSGLYSAVTDQGTFQSKVVVGADGRNSFTARKLGLVPGRILCRRVAWQATAPSSGVSEGVHMKFFSQGYIGTVPLNAYESNICVVINQPSKLTPQAVVKKYLGIQSSLSWKSVSPLSRKPGEIAKNSVLLIGDAARIIEPFTGEGTYMAMRSGLVAADSISQALKSNQFTHLANEYITAHHKLYRQMPFHNRLTRWLAWNPRIAQLLVRLLKLYPPLLQKLVHSNLYTNRSVGCVHEHVLF